ncbi:MAG: ATPase [Chloroflexus aggregans]|uniref:Circadian input-output histidine kinase CikA n=1 Tax=Chloroflexus aggregans TaxID=152260 RepID=A0A2J6X3Z6_9CHLR|nr:MAG: ATPase [Chloroflexus aggregans]
MQPVHEWQQRLHQHLSTSLRAKLSFFLSLMLTMIMLVAAFGVFRFIESIEQEGWAGRQREAAQNAVRTIDDFLRRIEDTLALVGALSAEQVATSPELLPTVLERAPAWIEIVRVTRDGRVIAKATRDRLLLGDLVTIPMANWFQQARAGQRYLGPLSVTFNSEPYIIVAVPANDGGVVAGRLRMNLLWETVAAIRFGRTGQAYIVDDQGVIIAHADPQLALNYTSIGNRPEFREFPPDGFQRFYINLLGEETLGVALNIPTTPWRLIAEIPESEATELSTRSGIIFTISLILSGFVILLATNYLLDRFTFRILAELRRGAERIGSGDLSQPLPVPQEREVAQVASAFNTMMHQLRARNAEIVRQTESLKAEVRERRRIEQELIRARDAAEAASRAKSTFLATMSHELRTPLTAIIGYSQLLEQLVDKGIYETVAHDVSRIRAAGNHLLTLINDILDISKIEAGRMTVSAEYADVADLVRNAVNTVLPQMEKNHNRLQLNCPSDIGMLNSDATKVRQALINLLSNAAKFTENGTVTLTVTRYEDEGRLWFRFTVADTGIGIPPDKIDKLFKAFSQIDDSPTRKYGGTGLGLALSQRLCELVGGRITVQSTVGVGSVFTIEVPAHLSLPTPVSSDHSLDRSGADEHMVSEAADNPTIPISQAIILVIDDDPTIGELFNRLIPKTEAYVVVAHTGAEGLRLATDLIPELIVLDMNLPDLHGIEVLARLCEDPTLAKIPIVVLTIDDQAQRGLTFAVSEYLVKPVAPDKLIQVVQQHCRRTPNEATDYILIVEDNQALAEMVARTLHTAGWHTEVVSDGEAGLIAVRSKPPGLILLDYLLPKLDGLQFLEALRADPVGRDIPVILMTARDLSADERQQLASSVNAILSKAHFDIEQIVVSIRDILQTKSTIISN